MAPPVQNNSPAAKPEPNLVAEFLGDFQEYCKSGEPIAHDTEEHGGTVDARLHIQCFEAPLSRSFYSGANFTEYRATFNLNTGGFFNAKPVTGTIASVPSLKSFVIETPSMDYQNASPGQKT